METKFENYLRIYESLNEKDYYILYHSTDSPFFKKFDIKKVEQYKPFPR